MANKINPFDPNVNSGLYNVRFPDFAFWLQKLNHLFMMMRSRIMRYYAGLAQCLISLLNR